MEKAAYSGASQLVSGGAACMEHLRNIYKILFGNSEGKGLLWG
jgi:hypothetical protein